MLEQAYRHEIKCYINERINDKDYYDLTDEEINKLKKINEDDIRNMAETMIHHGWLNEQINGIIYDLIMEVIE